MSCPKLPAEDRQLFQQSRIPTRLLASCCSLDLAEHRRAGKFLVKQQAAGFINAAPEFDGLNPPIEDGQAFGRA